MTYSREAFDAIELSATFYKERLIEHINRKYKDSFRLVNKKDVEDAVGELVRDWKKGD